jgi:hypothetical protein
MYYKEQLSEYSRSQQKAFSNFYARGFFGVSLTLHIKSISNTIKIVSIAFVLIGSAWVLPMKENERLEVEVKKRAIVRDELDGEIQRRVITREGVDAELKKLAMTRESAAKMA